MKGDFSRYTFDPARHYTAVLMQQGRVQLDADWNEQRSIDEHLRITSIVDVVGDCGAPAHNAGFGITLDAKGQILIGKGRYYVGGVLCENKEDVAYARQPHLPDPPDPAAVMKEAGADACLLYLDVWQRHITALDDPHLREVALDGPDTTTRVQTIWQVRALPFQIGQSTGNVCFMGAKALAGATGGASARLTAQATRDEALDTGCELPPGAAYTRLENDLYRVEVHQGGGVGTATLLWARHNATTVAAVVGGTGGREIVVNDLGPDDTLGFAPGQWITIADDVTELAGDPGRLLLIDRIDASRRALLVNDDPGPVDLSRRPKVRRWDSKGALPTAVGTPIRLEAGIEVTLGDGILQSGDFWLIPARTATGDVEWPPYDNPGAPHEPQPPLGIRHQYCPLAVLRPNSQPLDCRALFDPLNRRRAAAALHVVATSWENDALVSVQELVDPGLRITLDIPPDPRTLSDSTVVVTIEQTAENGLGALAHIMTGHLTVEERVVTWQADSRYTGRVAPQTYAASYELPPARVRIVLRGQSIWAEGPRRRYLDGITFGRSIDDGGRRRTGLILPSGDGLPASDFESWFFISSGLALIPAALATQPASTGG
jgi:Family of unknown function (DUF6519)